MQQNSPYIDQYCGYGFSNYERTGRQRVEINLTLAYVPDDVRQLYIFCMMLPQSSGAVYFEDMELLVLQ